jgi:tRNA(fMet)-specific endonuclease VapC
MILLDTDHLSVLVYSEHSQYATLAQRMLASDDKDFRASIVSFEEQTRGWLAEVNRCKQPKDFVRPYRKLGDLLDFYCDWELLSFCDKSAAILQEFRAQKIRVATQDLKIAAVALANDALLLTANSVDFERVPNLLMENWLNPPTPRIPR